MGIVLKRASVLFICIAVLSSCFMIQGGTVVKAVQVKAGSDACKKRVKGDWQTARCTRTLKITNKRYTEKKEKNGKWKTVKNEKIKRFYTSSGLYKVKTNKGTYVFYSNNTNCLKEYKKNGKKRTWIGIIKGC